MSPEPCDVDSGYPVPLDEVARQARVEALGVLDTAPDRAFDALTEAAAMICGTPIALITLIDGDRQWIKSRTGVDDREMPRRVAICTHAIMTPDQPFVVPDLAQDQRFATNPLVTERGLRFYGGSPLITQESFGLGALCVMDTRPRTLDEAQITALEGLSRVAVRLIETGHDREVLTTAFAERESAAARRPGYVKAFGDAYEHVSVAMALADPDHVLLAANDRFAALVGQSAQDLLGSDVNRWRRADHHDRALAAAIGAGSPSAVTGTATLDDGGGSARRLHLTSTVLRDLHGRPQYVIHQMIDVTLGQRSSVVGGHVDFPGDAVVSIDDRAVVTAWNPAAQRMFGYHAEEIVGQPVAILVPGRHLAAHHAGVARATANSEEPFDGGIGEVEARHRDGHEFPIELSVGRHTDDNRSLFTAVIRDVTAHREVRRSLQRTTEYGELVRRAIATANEQDSVTVAVQQIMALVCAASGHLIGHLLCTEHSGSLRSSGIWHAPMANSEDFQRLSESLLFRPGTGPGEALRQHEPVSMLLDSSSRLTAYRAQMALRLGLRALIAVPVIVKDDVVAVMELFGDDAEQPTPELLQALVPVAVQIGRVLERDRAQTVVTNTRLHDPLTGLPNRQLLVDRMRRDLDPTTSERRESSGRPLVLMFMDLDRFRLVNDTLGHVVGDELLRHVTARMQEGVRRGDVLSRFGDDEFVALCFDASPDDASMISERLVQSFKEPFTVRGERVHVGLTVGVAFAQASDTPEMLINDADVAMRKAKASGGGRVLVSDRQRPQDAAERMRQEVDLHRALELGQFVVHYQPTIDLVDGTIDGVEALLRWDHPTRGLVGPVDFIPALERNGLIVDVGTWVLREACAQHMRWRTLLGPDLAPAIAVNLSARQVWQDGLTDTVATILESTAIPPDRVTLEVTESDAVRDGGEVQNRFLQLRDLGVRIAIDDFGTGYSSLSRLQELPIDILKVDRSFVTTIPPRGGRAPIVDAVLDLGRALDLEVIAEGIETRAQEDYLKRAGVPRGQGFLYARPMPESDLTERLSG